jgi:choline dehydrogenase-like flavoprotein
MSTYNESVGEVDIIFAGGGTAACVAAGRLAKANPDLKIVLVEGGPNNFNNPTVTNPAVYLSHLAPDSKTALVSILSLSRYLIISNLPSSSTNPKLPSTSMAVKQSSPWEECLVVAHPSTS